MIHLPLVDHGGADSAGGLSRCSTCPIHIVWLELLIHPTALLVFQDLPRDGPPGAGRARGAARFFSAGNGP